VQVDFSRLTNLTALDLDIDGSNASFAAASQLPHSLQALEITAPAAPAALFMGLSQLRSLTIYQHLLPMPAVLQEMSRSLKQLTHLDLGAKQLPYRPADDEEMPMYVRYWEVVDSIEALAAMPLRKLHLKQPGPLTFFVRELHQLTQLTALILSDLSRGFGIQGFSIVEEQLKELTAQEQLELRGRLHGMWDGDDTAPADVWFMNGQPQSFMQTIARLPNLQQLTLKGMKLGKAAVELAASTSLRYVNLGDEGYGPGVAQALLEMFRRNEAACGCSVADHGYESD
jgi:hypothetical protein